MPQFLRRTCSIDEVVKTFEANVLAAEKLVNFDRDVLALVVSQLEGLHRRLKAKGFDNDRLNAGAELKFISTIRDNDSLRTRFQTISNQAIVLLVSHFASALGDLFRIGVSQRLAASDPGALLSEEVKVSFAELRDMNWNVKEFAADILIAKHDLTFQDMRSIQRAFDDYLDVSIERTAIVKGPRSSPAEGARCADVG